MSVATCGFCLVSWWVSRYVVDWFVMGGSLALWMDVRWVGNAFMGRWVDGFAGGWIGRL